VQSQTLRCLTLALAAISTASCGLAPDESPESAVSVDQGVRRAPPCPVCALDSSVAVSWFETVMALVRTETILPPVASRIYGYTGLTLYEALFPGMSPNFRSLGGQLNGLETLPHPRSVLGHDWPTVAHIALGAVTAHLFSGASPQALSQIGGFAAAQIAARRQAGVSVHVLIRSAVLGGAVAAAIIRYADADGFLQTRGRPFTPPVGEPLWVPTGTAPPTLTPVEPFWGTLRPFVLAQGDACAPPPPVPFSTDPGSAFFNQANTVYQTNLTLTEEQRTIALYWADNPGQTATPPGHWMGIVSDLVRNANLAVAAEAFALVGITTADAFISVWDTKYTHNLLRPETYIRRHIDATWSPLIPTPQFPEYTSGHSGVSGASATVLTDLFGVVPFTEVTPVAMGLTPRSFASFEAAAAEAAVSRLYAGIHYPMGNQNGIEQGQCVGQMVLAATDTRQTP
jgi:hypothetical protein